MTDRYFVESPVHGDLARLAGAEAHHLAHVMRAKLGDEVLLFDGSGAEFIARVERVGRAEIELAILSRTEVDRELRFNLTLGVALPKGDRQRWLVEKAVELGAVRLVPLQTERSNDRESATGLERLRRGVIEASKQCGRNRLMAITAPQKLGDFLAAPAASSWRLWAHPGEQVCYRVFEDLAVAMAKPAQVLLAIGPEGGFTPGEAECALAHQWQGVGLGPRILRVETAAIALASAVTVSLQHWDP